MQMYHFVPFFTDLIRSVPDKDEEMLARGRLSENFTVRELTRSSTARRLGIDNTPGELELQNLNALVDNVLQPAREEVGPIRVTSGYRGPELNQAVRGAKYSDHLKGMAADIETVPDDPESMLGLGLFIETKLSFKQMIWEFGGEWIHVSYSTDPSENKNQVLEAYKDGANRTRYRAYTFIS